MSLDYVKGFLAKTIKANESEIEGTQEKIARLERGGEDCWQEPETRASFIETRKRYIRNITLTNDQLSDGLAIILRMELSMALLPEAPKEADKGGRL